MAKAVVKDEYMVLAKRPAGLGHDGAGVRQLGHVLLRMYTQPKSLADAQTYLALGKGWNVRTTIPYTYEIVPWAAGQQQLADWRAEINRLELEAMNGSTL